MKEGVEMEEKKGLSSFATFWIFGCGVAFAGVVFSNQPMVWSGLVLLVVGIVAGALRK